MKEQFGAAVDSVGDNRAIFKSRASKLMNRKRPLTKKMAYQYRRKPSGGLPVAVLRKADMTHAKAVSGPVESRQMRRALDWERRGADNNQGAGR